MSITLDALSALPEAAFVDQLGEIFEHSPWVAEAVYPMRPFGSIEALHAAMAAAVARAGVARQLALLNAHPELSQRGTLTAASTAEQGSKGLNRLDADEAAQFTALNQEYRARFGFPFIIAVRGQKDRAAILSALRARLAHAPAEELDLALGEVAKIGRFRLQDLIAEAE